MSFENTPIKKFLAWSPNADFVKFFQNMKHRNVPENEASVVRVTNTKPPSTPQFLQKSRKGGKGNKSLSQSDIISDTAKSLTKRKYRNKKTEKSRKRKTTDKGKKSRNKKALLEKKIKEHSF